MSSLHKCNFFQPIILKHQQDSSGPIFTFMPGLCTLPLIFASLEQQKSGKSFYWCFWKECIKMCERGRNRKCINAGYGACVPSMIPHYTQIMQSPSLLHAAALRTNKTTSGTTQNLTNTQKHIYTNTPVHSIYLLHIWWEDKPAITTTVPVVVLVWFIRYKWWVWRRGAEGLV